MHVILQAGKHQTFVHMSDAFPMTFESTAGENMTGNGNTDNFTSQKTLNITSVLTHSIGKKHKLIS